MTDFLKQLRAANASRNSEWGGGADADPLFQCTELTGEWGEACNIVKKLEREKRGWRGSRSTVEALAEELGDVLICLDLVAATYGIDLAEVTAAKFNATSEKQGFAQMIKTVHSDD